VIAITNSNASQMCGERHKCCGSRVRVKPISTPMAVAVVNSVREERGLTIPSLVYALAPAKGRSASLHESHNSYHAPYVSLSRLAHSPNSTSAPPLSSGILPILDHRSENPFALNTPCETGLSLATFCTHQLKHYIPSRTRIHIQQ
jgi:hypothetical protein